MTTTFTSAAEAAAAWWADQVGAPVFRMVDDSSSPEDRRSAVLIEALQLTASSRHPVSSEQGEKFVAALAPVLADRLERSNWASLYVDYGPDHDLAEAAEAAGIHLSRFPWKTHMSVTAEYVTASLGYRAKDRLVWSAPSWERPSCGNHRYTDSGDPVDAICTLLKFHDEECGQWIADPARCGECGRSYAGHYGSTVPYLGHSYQPVVPS